MRALLVQLVWEERLVGRFLSLFRYAWAMLRVTQQCFGEIKNSVFFKVESFFSSLFEPLDRTGSIHR